MSTEKKNNTEKKTRLVASSFDYKILDKFLKELTKNMDELGVKYAGPIPLVNSTRMFLALRSPHVYKTSMEHFCIKVHRRIIDIYSLGENIKNIQFISDMNISHGIEIRMISINNKKKNNLKEYNQDNILKNSNKLKNQSSNKKKVSSSKVK
ncbi:hypothetical protein AB836_01910 [Rickettsiales bacterium (ex Bugula neritina AB1)]|nr:hypothetical protein AB836_01910 [Rickettsiales bacterium (ex Bugula neritina AB1)]